MALMQYMDLTWEVTSPSFWRLHSSHAGPDELNISFLGDRWYLHLQRADGSVAFRDYQSRDDAIGFVAAVCRQMGAL